MPTAAGRALPPEIRARLAARLPQGYDVEELRWLETEAQILPTDCVDDQEAALAARLAKAAETAGPPLINRDGKPTILKVVTWMCHAGVANKNGDSFVGEELKALSATLFREPNFGVMDWNHAAVLKFNDDPVLMGVWYRAEYAYHEAAQAWGLLVTGMMFGWLFPDQADALIAEQVRTGSIKGSMACIPGSVEFGDVGGVKAAILHNPVFFTHSLLDKPPADPHATGVTAEDPEVTADQLREALQPVLAAKADEDDLKVGWDAAAGAGWYSLSVKATPDTKSLIAALQDTLVAYAHSAGILQEESMTPEEIAALAAAKEAADHKVAELEQQIAELTAKLAELEAKLAAVPAPEPVTEPAPTTEANRKNPEEYDDTEELPKKKAALEVLEVQVAELTASKAALQSELEAAQAVIAERDQKIAELEQALGEYHAAEVTEVRAAKLATRKAELSPAYLAAHERHAPEVKARIEDAWLALDDAGWDLKKQELGATAVKVGFVRRTEAEGGVLPVASQSDILGKIRGSLKKR